MSARGTTQPFMQVARAHPTSVAGVKENALRVLPPELQSRCVVA